MRNDMNFLIWRHEISFYNGLWIFFICCMQMSFNASVKPNTKLP